MPVAGWNQLTSHRQDFPARPRARAPSSNKTKPNPPRCALASNYPQVRRSLSEDAEDQMAEPLSRHPARQTATLSPTAQYRRHYGVATPLFRTPHVCMYNICISLLCSCIISQQPRHVTHHRTTPPRATSTRACTAHSVSRCTRGRALHVACYLLSTRSSGGGGAAVLGGTTGAGRGGAAVPALEDRFELLGGARGSRGVCGAR